MPGSSTLKPKVVSAWDKRESDAKAKAEAAAQLRAKKQELTIDRSDRRRGQTMLQNLIHEEYRRAISEVYDLSGGAQLGSGGFGTVQVVTHRLSGKQYALKTIELELVKDKQSFDFFMKEVEIMKQLDHPNIGRLQEVYQTPDYLFLVMDLYTGGNLLESYQFQSERAAAEIVSNITNAVRYCHDRHIAHRDLKLDNILFEHSGPGAEIKLVDFGLSCYFSEAQMEHDVVGTWVGSAAVGCAICDNSADRIVQQHDTCDTHALAAGLHGA